jgi:hypothetical protein
MEERVQLVIDPVSREKIAIELPLSFRRNPEEARKDLHLPDFVDLSDPLVAKAVALADAAHRSTPPIPLAYYGGVANRLVSAASNDSRLGLRRPLHDTDIACLHRQLKRVRTFLAEVGDQEGSALTIFETPGDRIFNSLGEGRRFRFHDLRAQEGTEIDLGTVDLIADEFRFCHRLDVRSDVQGAPQNGWTLSPTLLLLAKLQFIQRIPATNATDVQDRVLIPFGRNEVVIGPEAKDLRDGLALLVDCSLDGPAPRIATDRFAALLRSDWGLWKTLGLNLALLERSPITEKLPPDVRAAILEKIARLRSIAGTLEPKRKLWSFSNQWWQDVDWLPAVDGPTPVG